MSEPAPRNDSHSQSAVKMSNCRYAVTDRTWYGESEPVRHMSLVAQAGRLAAEGIDFLQLREKDLPAQELIGLARRMITAIGESRTEFSPNPRLLVNGRADVALAAGAAGVHLPSGSDQLTVAQVRRLFAERGAAAAIVGVSCHTISDVYNASRSGADYVLFGPVFGKVLQARREEAVSNLPGREPCESEEFAAELPGTGLQLLAEACRAGTATAVFALGGVTRTNAHLCIAVGAHGIAGIRLFQSDRDRPAEDRPAVK